MFTVPPDSFMYDKVFGDLLPLLFAKIQYRANSVKVLGERVFENHFIENVNAKLSHVPETTIPIPVILIYVFAFRD